MAAGASRVFVSHLSGIAVFDPNGDQVGRVRDVVVMLRGQPVADVQGPQRERLPSVLGLVVEVVSRRRVFLPMTRVTGVESGQVITTGVVNMRRFEQRPTETLVLGELLDRQVTLVETGEQVTVLDVGIQQLPARRDWQVDKVFVRRGRRGKGGALRRRGETLTVDWSAVTGFSVEEKEQGAATLLATFERMRPADIANTVHHLSAKRRMEVAAALDDDRLADVLEELPTDDQIELLGELSDELNDLSVYGSDARAIRQLIGEDARRRQGGLGLQTTGTDRSAELLFELAVEWQRIVLAELDEEFRRESGPRSNHHCGP